jgi:hypothetical protein
MSAMAQDSQTTADLGPALVRGIWAAVIIAVIIVVLRVFAKVKIGQFRVDDVLMIVSLVCCSPALADPIAFTDILVA